MTATPPKPSLVKSTALAKAQTVTGRVNALLPTVPSQFSPVTVYQAGTVGVGAQLTAPTSVFPAGAGYYGTWTAPDLASGRPYVVQVECFGGGGGGGGGSSASGGGGGGGGEYASESAYPVVPGKSYVWQVGVPGSGGTANSNNSQGATAGGSGGNTIFDLAGTGVAGGVVAHGGAGGDAGNTGNGGGGGAGSSNSTRFAGGPGGINIPGSGGGSGGQGGTDNPVALFTAGLLSVTPSAWYVMNDSRSGGQLNDNTGNNKTAQPGSYAGGGLSYARGTAPSQVPAYQGSANPPSSPNPTTAQAMLEFNLAQLNQQSGYVLLPAIGWDGSHLTFSGWVQPDPSGTWGNTATGGRAVVVSTCEGYANASTAGTALYFKNAGTPSNPSWRLIFYVSDGSSPQTITATVPPVAGTPVYVVATFSAGAMKLYVNGTSAGTAAASFSSVPSWPTVPYAPTLGSDPQISTDWFFGYMSNFWFSSGVLSAAGVTQAYSGTGGSSTGGGAGGGASGGPAAIGGAGAAGSGSSGGNGGTPAAQPAADVGLNTPASAGIAGAANASGNSGITGSAGAGGGGAGQSSSPPAIVTVTVPFTTAASYCGTDASGGAAGAVYNPVIQGTTGRLFTGGTASDAASGSKNSLLILPPGLAASLKNGTYTVTRVTLTVFNANLQTSRNALMQVGWSSDTFLPITYAAGDIAGSAGVVEIPAGTYSVTADLTESQLGSYLQSGTATALVLGPGPSPSFAAYNAGTASNFYTAVYGPGAADTAGNSLAPYLTITYAQSATVQQGSPGGAGEILLTYLNQAQSLVGNWNAGTGINAQGGQLTETTLVLGSTITDATRLLTRDQVRAQLLGLPEEDVAALWDRLSSVIRGRTAGLGAIDGAPGTVLGYTSTPTTVTQGTPGSYTFTVPAGVTSLSIQCWGAGAGATGGSTSQGQGGGGGGAYAAEPAYAVNPGDVLHYTVGAGGTGSHVGTSASPDGGPTQFDTTGVDGGGVLANGGQHYQSALNYGPGGATSGSTVSFGGGNGGPINAFQSGGSGGGGSGGSAGKGFGGSSGGGAGGGGSGGGAAGGAGHGSGSNGSNGSAPGGGGGGAGEGSSAHTGGNGGNGQVSFTYISATTLTNSLATAPGTDAAGNPYPTGVMTNALKVNGNSATTGTHTVTGQLNANGGVSTNNVNASGTVTGGTLQGSLNAGYVSGTVSSASFASSAGSISGLSFPQSRPGNPTNPAPGTYSQSQVQSLVVSLTDLITSLANSGIIS